MQGVNGRSATNPDSLIPYLRQILEFLGAAVPGHKHFRGKRVSWEEKFILEARNSYSKMIQLEVEIH